VAIEEVVKSLPAAIPGIGPGTNNGSNGTATIDLRGLGTNRNLVLINGRRLTPATLGGVTDTNSIPVALIERVDLITGGASAVYGADAVAGVLNFVLRRDFEGVDFSATYGATEKGEAARRKVDFTLGGNFADGRGNAVLSIGKTSTEELRQGTRDFGAVSLGLNTGAAQGSSAAIPTVLAGMPAPLGGLRTVRPATGTITPFVDGDLYNFNPLNFYVTPLERTQATGLARFTINENMEAYAEITSTRSDVTLNLAPGGTFFNTYRINIGNPFIPEAIRNDLCGAYSIPAAECVEGSLTEISLQMRRRMLEMGPRVDNRENRSSQWTAGVRGTLPFLTDFGYDVYLQSGISDQLSTRRNWGLFSRVQQALIATNTTTCVNPANGCVPLNLFGAEGTITPQMLGFFDQPTSSTSQVKQSIINASINGEIAALKLPTANAAVSVAFGAEQRELNSRTQSDVPSQIQGEVLGTGAPVPDRSGTVKLSEVFAEAFVPVVNGLPGVHSLNLDLGFRQTDFKTDVSSTSYGTWKAGLDYSPVPGLRFRAMQQRATRAPSINELYAPVTTGLTGLPADPCQGANTNAGEFNTPGTLSNLCRLTGVPSGQVGVLPPPAAGQANTTSGGNPALAPEEADTTTLGLVYEPSFVPGLSLTFDYYRIKIQKAVSTATVGEIVNGCYDPALNPGFSFNAFCQLIGRDTLTGTFSGSQAQGIIRTLSNLGEYNVEGYDFGANYRLNVSGYGTFDIGLQGTQYSTWVFKSNPTADELDCIGRYGLDCEPLHKTKLTQRTTWRMGDFSVGYVWNYLSALKIQDDLEAAAFPAYRSVPAYNYFDLNASWQATKNLRLSAAVLNVADKKPPVVGNDLGSNFNSGNTFPQWYDAVGRRYSATVQLRF
jgi:outer membrane receptor protein involved in Fe transport